MRRFGAFDLTASRRRCRWRLGRQVLNQVPFDGGVVDPVEVHGDRHAVCGQCCVYESHLRTARAPVDSGELRLADTRTLIGTLAVWLRSILT